MLHRELTNWWSEQTLFLLCILDPSFKVRVISFISTAKRHFCISNFAPYAVSAELIVPKCVSWNLRTNHSFVVVCKSLCVPMCQWKKSVPMCGCMTAPLLLSVHVCARACSLLVEFNPSVRGVTAPQHTRHHSFSSTLTFYSSTHPTHTVHFCPKRAIKETNVFPKISWLPALHTNAMPSGCKYWVL